MQIQTTVKHTAAVVALCCILILGSLVDLAAAGPQAGAHQKIPQLLQQMNSSRFAERTDAQRALASLASSNPEMLAEAYPETNPEGQARLLQLLEGVFLAFEDERGDRAERAIESIRDAGSPAADTILTGNVRLREGRARKAIQRLGGELIYVHPQIASYATAPLIGVGFGEPAVLSRILIPEDWRGKPEDIWHLTRLSYFINLQLYNIRGSGLQLEDLLPLGQKFSGLRIEERGACLGIIAVGGSPVAVVRTVLKGGAAEAAGLHPNDEIIQLDEKPVRNFNHLVEILTEYQPGMVVQAQVRRNEQVIQLPIKLASWKTLLSGEIQTVPAPAPFPGPLGQGTPPSVPLPEWDQDDRTQQLENN